MSILPTLYKAYEKHGLTLLSGLNPARFGGLKQAAFTWLLRDGQSVTEGYGISLSEVQMLEAVLPAINPKTIFVLGNSFGFSTLAIALICPKAKVVAIDSGLDANTGKGVTLTDEIAKTLGLKNVTSLLATSPQDVASVVKKHLGGKVDFAFIDGLHTNAQIVLDAKALQPFCAPQSVLLFHDVMDFGLEPGLLEVAHSFKTHPHILHSTTSGLGLICQKPAKALQEALIPYCPSGLSLGVPTAMAAWNKQMRKGKTLRRLSRSVKKKLGLKPAPKPTFHKGSL